MSGSIGAYEGVLGHMGSAGAYEWEYWEYEGVLGHMGIHGSVMGHI